ncbi:hypothetical protein LTR78_009714 [Recurvomyces mirabilis]|uniref:Uncharacterized protein n=1 Tax=Recurvomyces mirabilis TaxID=574656 RepID=A0AAE0TR10_9PEZI|nr:hypothetical protein LTR78_009714 [Recurvomyces mirabilis]KAK5156337.1 hypothetical protein LTS14_005225 [Recurvomyces mirabilis]
MKQHHPTTTEVDITNDADKKKGTRRHSTVHRLQQKVRGIDFDCTDGADKTAPQITTLTLDDPDAIQEWFTSYPSTPCPALRLLTLEHRQESPHSSTRHIAAPQASKPWQPGQPFTQAILEHALWQHQAYTDLLPTRAGGCAALIDEPVCFILQTPLDSGPFCSLALSRRGHIVKGTYIYRNALGREERFLDPLEIMQGEKVISGWRASGMQIVSLPAAVARSQARYVSGELEDIAVRLDQVESALSDSGAGDAGAGTLTPITRVLQAQSSRLLSLERRMNLQSQILDSIEVVTAAHRHGTTPWPALAPMRNQIETWSHDMISLPRRIESAHRTIQTLIQQRNEQLNLAIAESSHRMMEAALRDNATMKTIAIMTMVFLPSTAVASFFSMQMFNWGVGGDSVVMAVPLTGLVVWGWWVWVRRSERRIEGMSRRDRLSTRGGSRDESERRDESFTDEVELETFDSEDVKTGAVREP